MTGEPRCDHSVIARGFRYRLESQLEEDLPQQFAGVCRLARSMHSISVASSFDMS